MRCEKELVDGIFRSDRQKNTAARGSMEQTGDTIENGLSYMIRSKLEQTKERKKERKNYTPFHQSK